MSETANVAEAERLRTEITEVVAALARVEADHREALADVTANGTWVMRTVLDSKRRPIEKMGMNPACTVLVVTERLRRSLTKRCAVLEDEIRKVEKDREPNHWAQFPGSKNYKGEKA